jgi:hypothetical protein
VWGVWGVWEVWEVWGARYLFTLYPLPFTPKA